MMNWVNRTLWTGDNLDIMRGMNSASVDLIYLDPPFNSKRDYAAPIGSEAAGAAFKDTWGLQDIDIEWLDLIKQKHPRLNRVIKAASTKSDMSYLIYMAPRVIEMHRILKPTGSIFLHCDPTMSHYLKLVMDAVFGKANFRNEIVWLRTTGTGSSKARAKRFPAEHDCMLFFSKAKNVSIFSTQYRPYSEEYIHKSYRHDDNDGKGPYQIQALKTVSAERFSRLEKEGRIVMGKGKYPRFKDYLRGKPGVPINDMWTDIPPVHPASNERTGYPTQKPLALLERIIKASSNDGDTVLDPFAGCATTCIAAEKLGRQWVGIDISPKAVELVRSRARRELTHVALSTEIFEAIARTDIPQRTDLGKIPRYNSAANRTDLYGKQKGHCAGCGEHFEDRHLEVDHIISQRKGGTDHIDNLQLLCSNCNRVKGDRGMEYLMKYLHL